MTEEDYEKYKEMFATDGWQMFIEQRTALRDNLHNACPTQAVTNDIWQYTRGQIITLDADVGFEQFIEVSWEQQQLEEEEEDEEVI